MANSHNLDDHHDYTDANFKEKRDLSLGSIPVVDAYISCETKGLNDRATQMHPSPQGLKFDCGSIAALATDMADWVTPSERKAG